MALDKHLSYKIPSGLPSGGKMDVADEECIKATKLANAHDFITHLPEDYGTMLTNNGPG